MIVILLSQRRSPLDDFLFDLSPAEGPPQPKGPYGEGQVKYRRKRLFITRLLESLFSVRLTAEERILI